MKVKTMITLLLGIFAMLATKAQLSGGLAVYPAHIQYRVYAIAQANQITEDKQLQLANFFNNRDKKVLEMIKAKANAVDLAKFYHNEHIELQQMLNPIEYARYMLSIANITQFLLAIAHQNEMALSDQQIGEILAKQNQFYTMQFNKKSEDLEWQEYQMVNILSKEQHYTFIKIMEKNIAENIAGAQIEKIVKWKLTDEIDSNQLKKDYINFLYKRSFQKARLNGAKNQARIDSLDKTLYFSKTFLMRKLELLENSPSDVKSPIARAICFRENLSLKGSQIDSLVNRFYTHRFMLVNSANANAIKQHENNAIKKILTEQQLTPFLQLNHKEQAEKNAHIIWEDLVKHQLTKGVDKKAILAQINDYELNRIVARERNLIFGNKETELKRKMVLANKPNILIALEDRKNEAAANLKAKQSMAW